VVKKNIQMTIKEFANELLLTFSKKSSLFSSQKIERFLSFSPSILIIVTYFCIRVMKIISREDLSVDEVAILVGLLLSYGGWTTKQIQNDKAKENTEA